MGIVHLTDANFKKEVLESDLTVLVDFWAPWCAPCKMIAPAVEDLAREYNTRLKCGKVNIDDNIKTAQAYGIMSIPTLVFFKKGKVMSQVVGALTKSELKKKIEENL